MNILEENLKNLKSSLNSSNINEKKEKNINNKNNNNSNINNNKNSSFNNQSEIKTSLNNKKKKPKIRSLSVTNVKIVNDFYHKKNHSSVSPKNTNLKNANNEKSYLIDRKKSKSISHKLNSFYKKKNSINKLNNNTTNKNISFKSEKFLFKSKIEKRNQKNISFIIKKNSISVTDRKKIKSISKSKNIFFNNLRENKNLSNKKFHLINSYYNQINLNKEKISNYSNQFRNIQKLFVNNLKGLYLNKSGDKLKCNKSMTFMIKKQKPKKTILEKLINNNNNENSLKKAIFWQNLKWLWFNKNIFIEQIINNYFDYKWFFDDGKLITKEICEEFFILRGINDKNFINNFFILFDFNKNGFINFTFAVIILIATSNNSYEEKIKKIFDILKDEKNNINFNIFLEIFNNIFLPFDKKFLINKLKKDLNIEKKKNNNNNNNNNNNKFFDLNVNYFYFENFLNKNEIKKILKNYFVKFYEIEENVEKEMGIAFMDLKKRLLNNNQFAKSIMKRETEKFENIINKLINVYNFKFMHKDIFNSNDFIVFNNNNENKNLKNNFYFQNYIKEFENKLN